MVGWSMLYRTLRGGRANKRQSEGWTHRERMHAHASTHLIDLDHSPGTRHAPGHLEVCSPASPLSVSPSLCTPAHDPPLHRRLSQQACARAAWRIPTPRRHNTSQRAAEPSQSHAPLPAPRAARQGPRSPSSLAARLLCHCIKPCVAHPISNTHR